MGTRRGRPSGAVVARVARRAPATNARCMGSRIGWVMFGVSPRRVARTPRRRATVIRPAVHSAIAVGGPAARGPISALGGRGGAGSARSRSDGGLAATDEPPGGRRWHLCRRWDLRRCRTPMPRTIAAMTTHRPSADPEPPSIQRQATLVRVTAYRGGSVQERDDRLSGEEPLAIRAAGPGEPPVDVAVTMRTPGHERELAAGFLRTEGLIDDSTPIDGFTFADPATNS